MYRGCIAFAVYSNSQATMDIMLPSPGLEEPPSGQSNILSFYFCCPPLRGNSLDHGLGYLISSDL